ncbi:MAG: NFACT family protein [Clostridia bacterium]|nr:NFACT family protein [Clostridia bacterium]
MPMDGLTLHFMTRELAGALVPGRIDRISQPEADEILLQIRCGGNNHTLLLSASAGCARAHLTHVRKGNPLQPPMFCMLLRKHLTGGRIKAIRQVSGDRILEIDIEHLTELGDTAGKTLICEFMGKHSNLILTNSDGKIIDAARHVTSQISRVREVLPGLPYVLPPMQDRLDFGSPDPEALEARLRGCGGPLWKALGTQIVGLSRQTAQELAFRAAGSTDARAEDFPASLIARRVCETLSAIDGEAKPMLLLAESGEPIDVVAFPYRSLAGLPWRGCESLSRGMDEFYRARDNYERISQKSAALRHILRNNIERCEKKLALQEEAIANAARMEEYRLCGELLTAGAGQIRKGDKSARVINYYDPEMKEILIPLDEKLSPTQNAQRYFKLYQKARSARDLAADQKEKTLQELRYLENQAYNLEECDTEAELNEIRAELEKQGYVGANRNRSKMKQLPPSRPLHFVSSRGIDILVGKNNLQNDKLTQSAGALETWLHAKDMPGSHVIIVSEAPDRQTLYEAALLAARYSRGASGSQVPVDYTLRKYVKKPGGAKPGFVIYTHQKTLFVTPDEESMKGIKAVRSD